MRQGQKGCLHRAVCASHEKPLTMLQVAFIQRAEPVSERNRGCVASCIVAGILRLCLRGVRVTATHAAHGRSSARGDQLITPATIFSIGYQQPTNAASVPCQRCRKGNVFMPHCVLSIIFTNAHNCADRHSGYRKETIYLFSLCSLGQLSFDLLDRRRALHRSWVLARWSDWGPEYGTHANQLA